MQTIFNTIDGGVVAIIDGDIDKQQVVLTPIERSDIIIASFNYLVADDLNIIAKAIINAKLRNALI